MYLKRIEISGFKSFATKTVLDFLPSCNLTKVQPSSKGGGCGITAIVGPNGSGKSNVADAIKWAMGEQSLKNLRGKKSEDVIFAGSGKKAQLGSAKVTLFFDNSDKKIPIEFEEVSISRKVYRSGEGEYMINGSKVRLIDVLDLLAAAGIGQRSYCIINQGMADAALNATPVERRIILEEAAGVKPYQLKKERSLRKLEATRANLSRVSDLVREIEPHLRVLKRQADKARKGEEVARELKEKQKILFGFLWREITAKYEKIALEKEEIGREEMKMQRKIDDLQIKVNQETKTNIDFENQRNILEKEREEKFARLNEVRKNLSIVEAKIEIEKEKAKNFARISEIPVDFEYFKEEFRRLRSEYEGIEMKLAKVKNLDELEGIKNDFRALKREIDRIFRELNEGKKEQVEERQRENTINLKVIGNLEEERKILFQKQELLNREIEKNRQEMEGLFQKDRATRQRYFELEAELRQKQEILAGIRERLNEAKVRMARVEVKKEDLRTRIKNEMGVDDPEQVLMAQDLSSLRSGEGIDTEKLEKEVARLKVLAEQIGAIDPLIIEEYEETQKRYDFLVNESQDLEKAIVSLGKVVEEMDEKIKISFEETFKKVNSEFAKYFKIIFGGGSAEMTKVKIETRKSRGEKEINERENEDGEENSLADKESEEKGEIGVEIKACPPGKRISSLSMLSGGERSLTSLALLFAIIANNPPPFAVLDEVEAALDEANSKRFGRILAELSGETQFILITHNRETMRQASLLYGVTMGVDGISKVLSVKLDQVGERGEIK